MTKIITDDVVTEIIIGFDNRGVVTCPICRANIDLICQKLESESSSYLCANCGYKIKRNLCK